MNLSFYNTAWICLCASVAYFFRIILRFSQFFFTNSSHFGYQTRFLTSNTETTTVAAKSLFKNLLWILRTFSYLKKKKNKNKKLVAKFAWNLFTKLIQLYFYTLFQMRFKINPLSTEKKEINIVWKLSSYVNTIIWVWKKKVILFNV